jgi:hypothetical protein
MRALRRNRWVAMLTVASLLATVGAVAQTPTRPAAPAPSGSKMDEARARYQRGLDLYADKNYEAARIEFARAYKLAPSYKILYNIGVCDGQLGDYVSAISSLEKYLEQGKSEVPADRQTEVQDLLKQLRPRIAKLIVTSNVTGALVQIDDVNLCEERGTCSTPMSVPMLVNPGRRRVTVSKAGWIPQTRSIVVAGSENAKIDIILNPSVITKNVNFLPYAMWGATVLLAAGAGVTGYLSLHYNSQEKTNDNTFGVSDSTLDNTRTKFRTFGITADVLTGCAVVAGGLALYFTFRPSNKENPTSVQGGLGPGALLLRGTF